MGELLYKGRSLNTTPEDICYENEARNMRVGDVGGKNLIPYPYSNKSGNYNGVEITINDDYSISVNGTNTGGRNDFGFAGISRIADIPYMVSLKAGKSYTLSLEFFSGSLPDTSDVVINGWNDNSVVMLLAVCDSSVTSFTFTVPADSGINHGCVYLQNKSGTVFDNVRLRPMLTEGNEVVPYEPYIPSVKMLEEENKQQNTEAMDLKMLGWTVPKECPIQNYTDANGVFHQRVDRVDLGSLTWERYDTTTSGKYRMGSAGISTLVKKPSSNSTKFNGYSSKYSVITSDNAYACIAGIGVASTTGNVYVYDEEYATLDDVAVFKTAMSGVYLYYELATEKTINVYGNEAVTKVNDSLSAIGKCKNLLNPTLKTTTLNGVTCTNNGDGTYTLDGTATKDTYFVLEYALKVEGNETYKIVAFKNVTNKFFAYINAKKADGTIAYSVLHENSKPIGSISSVYKSLDIGVGVLTGATLSNEIIKPILTTNINATYDDFVPYTGDGETLYADVAKIKNDIVSLNLLASPYNSSMTYNFGAFCSYANNIYQCKTKISTPEEFSPNKWKKIAIGDYLAMITPYAYCSKSSSVSIDLSKYMMNYEVIIGKPKSAAGISSNIGRYWVNISNTQNASDIFKEQDSQVVSSITLSNNILNIEFTSNEYHTVVIRPIIAYTPT